MGKPIFLTGTEILDGDIRLGHTFYEVDVLKKFIKSKAPHWFIEIGVHEGGLSYLLIPFLCCHYIGIEITCEVIKPQVREIYETTPTAQLWCADAHNQQIFYIIWSLSGKRIIYCDGGNKPLELALYKNICRSGDVIMAHDFSDGIRMVRDIPKYVEDIDDEFPRPEVFLKDVEHLDSDPNFSRLPEDTFRETRIVGWEKI